MNYLVVLLIGIIFVSFCIQEEQPPPGGGGGGPPSPPTCFVSLSLESTGIDTCTIKANITANYCEDKTYEIKNLPIKWVYSTLNI